MKNKIYEKQIQGSWELVSYKIFNNMNELQPSDKKIDGRLIYSSDGFMSVVITRGSATQNLADIIAYSGRYEIDEEHINHYVEVSSVRNFYNSVQRRYFKIRDNLLELATTERSDGKHVIIWKRITHSSE